MTTETQQQKQEKYQKYVKKITPTHSLPLNMAKAFLTDTNPVQRNPDRTEPLSPYRKVWRCRRTGSHYRLCQLCGSFRY